MMANCPDKSQRMCLCIDLDTLPGWLFSIDARVLADHFINRKPAAPRRYPAPCRRSSPAAMSSGAGGSLRFRAGAPIVPSDVRFPLEPVRPSGAILARRKAMSRPAQPDCALALGGGSIMLGRKGAADDRSGVAIERDVRGFHFSSAGSYPSPSNWHLRQSITSLPTRSWVQRS